MKCKLCGCENVKQEYVGIIRNGGLEKYTDKSVTIYRCNKCQVIWHEKNLDIIDYYESNEYREALEGTVDEDAFYKLHDRETLEKLSYTGTDIYRNKIVGDIGCGCGAFLDYISGVAKQIVAVEPTESYRAVLKRKGYSVYTYADAAKKDYMKKLDIVTSFDVIEHVEDPISFLKDIYDLLKVGGQAFVGTPTETPIMRKLLGEDFERKLLFSTQHLWIFSNKNLKMAAINAGFMENNISFKYSQRYGIGNLLGWLKYKEPRMDINDDFITETLDGVWKSECSSKELSDYIILCLVK